MLLLLLKGQTESCAAPTSPLHMPLWQQQSMAVGQAGSLIRVRGNRRGQWCKILLSLPPSRQHEVEAAPESLYCLRSCSLLPLLLLLKDWRGFGSAGANLCPSSPLLVLLVSTSPYSTAALPSQTFTLVPEGCPAMLRLCPSRKGTILDTSPAPAGCSLFPGATGLQTHLSTCVPMACAYVCSTPASPTQSGFGSPHLWTHPPQGTGHPSKAPKLQHHFLGHPELCSPAGLSSMGQAPAQLSA